MQFVILTISHYTGFHLTTDPQITFTSYHVTLMVYGTVAYAFTFGKRYLGNMKRLHVQSTLLYTYVMLNIYYTGVSYPWSDK